MKLKFSQLATQVLLVLNCFVLFLLLFSNKLVLPYWLQPIGRIHPMLLHFPITLLLLWVVLYWYGKRKQSAAQEHLHLLKDVILLSGAMASGITVIAGLFLSREAGYSKEELFWHQWTGALLFFLSSTTYVIGQTKYRKIRLFNFSPFLIALIVIFTGHFGGNITHGNQFILEPILSKNTATPVVFDSAEVYRDLVQPLLSKKCSSCHNAQKMKGELSLADSTAILKGGKTGPLFIPGQAHISLLVQRILLPSDDEHHMPPLGKPQLSNDEINVLTWWVKNHNSFQQRLSTIPEDDSLVVWAKQHLNGSSEKIPHYEFKAADAATIAQLNTSYRSVLVTERESPALEARLFSKDSYENKQLVEMEPIREQLVALNLSKLPVTDADLKTIAQFENLRSLDLNFTNISNQGLAALTGLQQLEKLSIAGNSITSDGLKETLQQFKNLKTVTLWNTRMTGSEMSALEQALKGVHIIQGFDPAEGQALKLNPPQLKNSIQVFRDSIWVELRHPIKGTAIRYTTNDKEPDSVGATLFIKKILLTETTNLTTKAFKQGWYASNVAHFGFYKNSFVPDSVNIETLLNHVHLAEGPETFFNGRLGSLGANNPAWANFWAGVRNNDLSVACFFKNPIALHSFGLRYMVEEATGIYPPEMVEIWGGSESGKLKLLGKIVPSMPMKEAPPSIEFGKIDFKKTEIRFLKIIAHPHAKKKDKHLLLTDEFFLN